VHAVVVFIMRFLAKIVCLRRKSCSESRECPTTLELAALCLDFPLFTMFLGDSVTFQKHVRLNIETSV